MFSYCEVQLLPKEAGGRDKRLRCSVRLKSACLARVIKSLMILPFYQHSHLLEVQQWLETHDGGNYGTLKSLAPNLHKKCYFLLESHTVCVTQRYAYIRFSVIHILQKPSIIEKKTLIWTPKQSRIIIIIMSIIYMISWVHCKQERLSTTFNGASFLKCK